MNARIRSRVFGINHAIYETTRLRNGEGRKRIEEHLTDEFKPAREIARAANVPLESANAILRSMCKAKEVERRYEGARGVCANRSPLYRKAG